MEKKALSKITDTLVGYNSENPMATEKLPNIPIFIGEVEGVFYEDPEETPNAMWQLHQATGYDSAEYRQIFGISADYYDTGEIRQLFRISRNIFAPESIEKEKS